MTAEIQDRRPALPYAQRFVWGKVISVELDVLHLRLETQNYDLLTNLVPLSARVRKEDWPSGYQSGDYPPGSRQRIFLDKPSHEDSHLWHASLAWGDGDDNPWNPNSPYYPLRGRMVSGTVISYTGNFSAFVRLDNSGIDAFLHQSNIPEKCASIRDSLQVGDRIKAEVVEGTDPDRLNVVLSVNAAIATLKAEFFQRYDAQQRQANREANKHAGLLQEIVAESFQPFSGVRLLVVEHDAEYARQLLGLLEGLGAKVVLAEHQQHVESLLREPEHFTHLISDYQMGSSEQSKKIFSLLKRTHLPVALMSGDYAGSAKEATKWNWVVLCKPVSYADLRIWLLDGKNPTPAMPAADISAAWGLGLESRATLKRAQPALAEFCQATGALAACWVRQQRLGVYAHLASHGLKNGLPPQIEAQLGVSLIASATETHSVILQSAAHAGPLRPLAEKLNAAGVWGIPLESAEQPDALLVFSLHQPNRKAELPSAWNAPLRQLDIRLSDLAEMTLLTERLREAEAFATTGRVAGAILHEIRQALQGLETYTTLANKHLAAGAVNDLAEDVKELIRTRERITRLAKTNLYNLQKARREEVNLNQRIPEILVWFEPRIQRHEHFFHCELPEHPITLFLPPEAVEQPLANLLDNAVYHSRKWGEIRIAVRWDGNDSRRPAIIEVRDQGQGMTAEQLDHLFTPRASSKGVKGYGLGLYASRQLLHAVGGELEVVREECYRWLGSVFRIRLPDKISMESNQGATK